MPDEHDHQAADPAVGWECERTVSWWHDRAPSHKKKEQR